jgi:hypothetical protein
MGCIGESHEGATACLPATPATDTARGASADEMHQVRDSARCPLYESGLRRPWQRTAGRRVWLLCHQCTHHPPLSAAAGVSAGVHLIRPRAWRGLRQRRGTLGGTSTRVGNRGGSTPSVGHVRRNVCTRGDKGRPARQDRPASRMGHGTRQGERPLTATYRLHSRQLNARFPHITGLIRSRKHGGVEALRAFTQIGAKWIDATCQQAL